MMKKPNVSLKYVAAAMDAQRKARSAQSRTVKAYFARKAATFLQKASVAGDSDHAVRMIKATNRAALASRRIRASDVYDDPMMDDVDLVVDDDLDLDPADDIIIDEDISDDELDALCGAAEDDKDDDKDDDKEEDDDDDDDDKEVDARIASILASAKRRNRLSAARARVRAKARRLARR